ncbi:MAG: hypothetical protein SXV54_20325, partial [Chloroflexota bacterium]|nr:hypothetical protein [Chloroflexota bacterium]
WPPQPLLSNRAEIRTTTGEKPSNDSNEAEISSSVALAWPYVVKTGPTLALPGETITYVVEYGNGGLLPAEGVWLTDTLPVSTTYVADTSGLTPVTGSGWISWNVGTISSETTGLTFTLVVSVSPDVPLGIPLRNSITLTSTTYDGDRTDNESEWTTPVGFDLSNSYKLVNGTAGTSVGSGTPVTYTIVLTNRGPYSATSVLVRDPVPADTAYITQSLSSSSGEDGYDPVDDVIIWMGIVSDHTMVTVTFQVTVADAGLLPRGTLITNAAFISDSIQTFQASVPVTITGPNLDGSYKTVNNLQPSQGERITYTIVLSNSGEADAIGAVMTDDLPSAYYATYAGDGSASSGSLGGGGSGDSITWTGTITTSHQVTILLPVKVVAGPGNHFANTAHIDDGTGRIIQRSVTVSTTKPILEAEKVASAGQVASGGRVTYTIAVTNSGNGWAWSARVTDTIQGGSYISSQVTASSGALNASPPPTITWTGPLTPGFSVRITIPVTITAPPGSDVDNVAQISDGYETVFNRSTSVHVYSTADISNSIKAVDLPAASPGETLVYTLTVVNDGESATSFVVTDTPDAATAFTGFIGSPPGSYGYTAGVITWTGTANGSSQAQLSFQTIISDSASGAVTNTAHFDGAGQVYTRTARTQILVPAELTATKQVEPVGPALAGEYLTYTIIVSNPGGEVARAILTDTIPTHTDYIFGSAEGPPTHAPPLCDGSTLTWQDDVAPDEAVTLTFQVMVTPGTVTGTVVSNVAWLQELNEPGPVFSDSVTNTVLSPVFTATKRATPAGFVLPGKPLTYSIVVTNVEAGIARVVITDPIPLDTTYITGSAQVFPGTHNPPTCAYGVLTWQGDVDSQSMVRLTFAVTVSQNITVGEAISNVAQVQELSQPDDGLLFRATNVVATPGLDADKRVAPPGDVFVGNILTYTIVMSNNGTAPAQVSFSDPLPAHTTYVTGSAQIAPATHDAPVYHPVPPTLTWDDEIAPGEQATLTFQARVEPGTLTGTVVGNVAWLQELTEPGPVFSTSVTNTVLAPVFTATKHSTPPGGVRVGETISYSIVLTNAEEGIAQVVVTDSIPAHTTYISASAGTSGGEAPPVYDPVNDWLTWQGDITPRSVVTLTFAVMVDLGTGDGEIIANVAQVQEMSRPDIVSGVSVTNPVIAPDVSILKQVEPSGDVLAGTALSYTVVIINDGGAAAQVTFSDTMPAHTTFVTDSARVLPETHLSPSYADGTLTWQDEIGPGQLAAISFEAQVEPGTPAGVTIYNVAWVQELSNPTSVYSDSATNSVLAPAFAAVKRSTPSGSVHPGDVLDYNIILANAASEGIARAVVTDTIPDHTTYISRSAGIDAGGLPLAAPGYDPVNDRLTWQGDIPSGSTITLTFAVTVSLDITTATVITNTAWVDELSDPAGAVAYSAFNDVVTGYDIYLPVVLRNY